MINSFWALRRSCKITNLQADLYFFLLHESNSRNWQNPFYCSNQLVCASLGVTEKSVIEARKALAELGLIEFENGITKTKAPKYYLLDYCNKVSNPVSIQGSIPVSNPVSNPVSIERNILNKQNRNKNKTKHSSGDHGSPAKESVSGNWNLWVESWVKFYEQKNNSVSPNFGGAQARALKDIKNFLEKNFQKKFPEEDCAAGALDSWKFLLDNHHKLDQWLQGQFDLTVIYKKINDIMSQLLNVRPEKRGSEERLSHSVQERLKRRFSGENYREAV